MTTNCTTTTVDSFQILDPIVSPPPGTNPMAYLESGYTNLPISQQVTSVVFQATKASAYKFVELDIVNVTDATPIKFSFDITAQPLTGFTISLSGLPDTSAYFLQWTVQVTPS